MANLESVASMLARGPMPLSQSAKIVAQLCALLAPLHDQRRTHSAVTPENVYFRHVGGELTVELRDLATAPTQYATPEQIAGRPEGPSGDVYCLGVLFFHMITGVPPFDGRSKEEIREKHRTKSPPELGHNQLQDIPLELEALVHSMLAKDPFRRPPVRQIATDIDNLDLDSTVMGVRIQAALDPDATEATETPDLDPSLLHNVDVEARTDPHLVDPYADTLIKDRTELGLDDIEGVSDTHLDFGFRKPISGWNEEDATRILDQAKDALIPDPAIAPSAPPRPPAPPRDRSVLLFGFGVVFFLAALAMAAFAFMRS